MAIVTSEGLAKTLRFVKDELITFDAQDIGKLDHIIHALDLVNDGYITESALKMDLLRLGDVHQEDLDTFSVLLRESFEFLARLNRFYPHQEAYSAPGFQSVKRPSPPRPRSEASESLRRLRSRSTRERSQTFQPPSSLGASRSALRTPTSPRRSSSPSRSTLLETPTTQRTSPFRSPSPPRSPSPMRSPAPSTLTRSPSPLRSPLRSPTLTRSPREATPYPSARRSRLSPTPSPVFHDASEEFEAETPFPPIRRPARRYRSIWTQTSPLSSRSRFSPMNQKRVDRRDDFPGCEDAYDAGVEDALSH